MDTSSSDTPSAAVLPAISLDALASGLGSTIRLKMLREIAMSESGLLIVELSERLGLRATNASKHMKVLRDYGLVVTNRAGMHMIPPERLVSREEAVVDYGTCLLRLGAEK
jgi:DNA-binding transcriptional ArsR family regulator